MTAVTASGRPWNSYCNYSQKIYGTKSSQKIYGDHGDTHELRRNLRELRFSEY